MYGVYLYLLAPADLELRGRETGDELPPPPLHRALVSPRGFSMRRGSKGGAMPTLGSVSGGAWGNVDAPPRKRPSCRSESRRATAKDRGGRSTRSFLT